jgi:hypothetical protein
MGVLTKDFDLKSEVGDTGVAKIRKHWAAKTKGAVHSRNGKDAEWLIAVKLAQGIRRCNAIAFARAVSRQICPSETGFLS